MVFQRSDLELVLQQIVLAGELANSDAPPVIGAATAGPASLLAADGQPVESAYEARIVEALRDAILATNDLDFINSWLAEDIDELPTDEAASAALAWDLERVIAAARKIADAASQEATAHRPAPANAPLLLNAARAELSAENADESLRPFGSWAELLASLKQTDRVIELIARYGTHEALLAAATIAEKRAVATLLVLGSKDTNGNGVLDESEMAPADRLDFLHARSAYAGGALGGLNHVELKIAGLGAATSPIDSDFVFESEIETLQGTTPAEGASDTGEAGQVTAISNGSSVVLTGEGAGGESGDDSEAGGTGPAVDARQQFVRVGLDGRSIEDGSVGLRPLASSDLVLVGTEAADVLAGGAGNDTISGEAGNDQLSGGAGNDRISGGAGDDTISGGTGDDVVTGGDGNDQLDAGDGDDIVITGAGSDEADSGAGNDFVLSDEADVSVSGGAGDDWIEGGGASVSGDDAGSGEGGGNDVVLSGSGEVYGGGGADIFVANGSESHYHGGKGFDWIVHAEPSGSRNGTGNGAEGLSGSGGDDHIQGDDRSGDQLTNGDDALTDVTLVTGLQTYLDESLGTSGASVFDGGNIILGGGGSDTIQGGGGDDIIDGDLALQVSILVDANANGQADAGELRVSTLAELDSGILDGSIDAGSLQIVREIVDSSGESDIDTAVFSGRLAEYEIAFDGQVTTVVHRLIDAEGSLVEGSIGSDGIDRLTRIERLQFSDQFLVLRANGDTYVWQVPAALAVAIAEAIDDQSSSSGSGSSNDDDRWRDDDHSGSGSGSSSDQLAAAVAEQDLGWLFDDDDGDTFDFSSLSAGDLGLVTDTAILAGSSGSGSLDLSGIDWLLGSDGDMFAFASSDTDVPVIDLSDLPVTEDVAAVSLGQIDDSYIGYQVEIVGVHDIMAVDYAV